MCAPPRDSMARFSLVSKTGQPSLNVRPCCNLCRVLLKMDLLPLVIFDIAIQHKGCIAYAFEVVHKNGVSEVKTEYLNRISSGNCIEVYTIDADWILSRIKRPQKLVCQRVI